MREISAIVAVCSRALASAAVMISTLTRGEGSTAELTWGLVIIWIDWYTLLRLDVVDALENGEAMADANDTHFLQLFLSQRHQSFARDFVF